MGFIGFGRQVFVEGAGRSRPLLEVTLLCFTVLLHGCEIPNILPSELKKEKWRIVGIKIERRFFSGKLVDRYIAACDFPGGKVERIVSVDLPDPDGRRRDSSIEPLAYNETRQMLVCMESRPPTWAVWLYHIPSKQGKWIARKRWQGITTFAWSKDGQQLAFTATELPMKGPRRGSVYIYDITTNKLTEVADDGAVQSSLRTPSPVWGGDGKYLYYTSIDRELTRIELSTLVKEKLSVKADAILSVRGKEIVYWKSIPARKGRGTERLIFKSTLDPVHGESNPVLVYEGWDLQGTIVSPTGRYILTGDRCGWSAATVVIDTKTCKSYTRMYHHVPSRFNRHATCLSTGARE